MVHRAGSLLALHFVLSALFGPPLLAQLAADAVFGEVVDVELVNLRVWVNDAEGNPVAGLSANEFVIEVDGEKISVTHFSEIQQAQARTQAETIATTEATTEVAPPVAASVDTEASMVVYIDELHLNPLGRKQVFKDLRELVKSGDVGTERIMVLRQGKGLISESSFGATEAELDRVLKTLIKPPADSERAPMEKQLTLDRLWQEWELARQTSDRDPCGFFVRSSLGMITTYAQSAATRAEITAGHLADVASSLGGIPGVKALLYVGDSLDLYPGNDLLKIVSELCPGSSADTPAVIATQELSDRFDRLTQRANASRVTIYTLEASGLRPGRLSGADQQTTEIRSSASFERALRTGGQSGLEQLAAQTGGQAMLNRNRFDRQLKAMARDMTTYYSLGFPAPDHSQARQYRFAVKVKRPGLKVRYRDNYRLKPPSERIVDRILSAIQLGVSKNPLEVRLASGKVVETDSNLLQLPLHVRIPIERITYIPTSEDERELANLQVVVTSRSPDRVAPAAATRNFRFQRPEQQEGLVDLQVELQLSPGIYILGVGVRDQSSGEESYVSTTIEVRGGEASN